MKRNTKVELYLCCGEESESFKNFQGIVPRVGEGVVFYKKIHDGAWYHGIVTSVEHRIEYARQNDKSKSSRQIIKVVLEEKEGWRPSL